MENKIVIYRDKDENGYSYCVYIDNECKGTYLSDDLELVNLAGKDWEKYVVDGLQG